MGTKLIFTGIFFIIALTACLKVFGLNVQEDLIVVVGAVLMGLGLFFLWTDR